MSYSFQPILPFSFVRGIKLNDDEEEGQRSEQKNYPNENKGIK